MHHFLVYRWFSGLAFPIGPRAPGHTPPALLGAEAASLTERIRVAHFLLAESLITVKSAQDLG